MRREGDHAALHTRPHERRAFEQHDAGAQRHARDHRLQAARMEARDRPHTRVVRERASELVAAGRARLQVALVGVGQAARLRVHTPRAALPESHQQAPGGRHRQAVRDTRRAARAPRRLRPVLSGRVGARRRARRLLAPPSHGLRGRVPGLLLQDGLGRQTGRLPRRAGALRGAASAAQVAAGALVARAPHWRRARHEAARAQRLLSGHLLSRPAALRVHRAGPGRVRGRLPRQGVLHGERRGAGQVHAQARVVRQSALAAQAAARQAPDERDAVAHERLPRADRGRHAQALAERVRQLQAQVSLLVAHAIRPTLHCLLSERFLVLHFVNCSIVLLLKLNLRNICLFSCICLQPTIPSRPSIDAKSTSKS